MGGFEVAGCGERGGLRGSLVFGFQISAAAGRPLFLSINTSFEGSISMSNEFESITCGKLAELCKSNERVELIDVRTPIEFREVHSVHARNVPLDSLNHQAVMAARNG